MFYTCRFLNIMFWTLSRYEKGVYFPLRGNSFNILFISSERVGILKLNLAAMIEVSIEAFWHSYT